jgi:uncharacterized protein YcbK (DUF882 family)
MDRRLILSIIAGTLAISSTAHAAPIRPLQERRLRLVNPRTKETFEGIYRDVYGPDPTAMSELSAFLRDFHSGATIPIDIGVIDFLAAVMDAIAARSAIILSAYRTPETNALLSQTTFGVAENSQHLYGRALDVQFEDRLPEAMLAARAMQRGGVGWYPHSGFMHIDTGPVRNWDLDEGGLGALLFDGSRFRFDSKQKSDGALRAARLPPELEKSGRALPLLQHSGQLSPELGRVGQFLR